MLKYIVPNGAGGAWGAGVGTQVVGLQHLRSPGLIILSAETANQNTFAGTMRAGGQAASIRPGIGLPDEALGSRRPLEAGVTAGAEPPASARGGAAAGEAFLDGHAPKPPGVTGRVALYQTRAVKASALSSGKG